jgi:hypothetical protein
MIDMTFGPQDEIAYATDPAQHWPYWRTFVRARPAGGGAAFHGWFEASRFGLV